MNLLTEQQTESFRAFIRDHDFFYIAGHKEPDGDCIFSCLSLGLLIQSAGKPYQLLSAGPFKRPEIHLYEKQFSPSMQFLTEEERRHTGLIISDCSEFARLGDLDGDVKKLDTFVIDHHKTAACPAGAQSIIVPSAPATCSLVQMLYEGIAGSLPKEAAEYLFVGLSTDTGFSGFLRRTLRKCFMRRPGLSKPAQTRVIPTI